MVGCCTVVVFGINSVNNGGKKILMLRGTAEHYYTFHTCIVSNDINKSSLKNKVCYECLPKKTKVTCCFISW